MLAAITCAASFDQPGRSAPLDPHARNSSPESRHLPAQQGLPLPQIHPPRPRRPDRHTVQIPLADIGGASGLCLRIAFVASAPLLAAAAAAARARPSPAPASAGVKRVDHRAVADVRASVERHPIETRRAGQSAMSAFSAMALAAAVKKIDRSTPLEPPMLVLQDIADRSHRGCRVREGQRVRSGQECCGRRSRPSSRCHHRRRAHPARLSSASSEIRCSQMAVKSTLVSAIVAGRVVAAQCGGAFGAGMTVDPMAVDRRQARRAADSGHQCGFAPGIQPDQRKREAVHIERRHHRPGADDQFDAVRQRGREHRMWRSALISSGGTAPRLLMRSA